MLESVSVFFSAGCDEHEEGFEATSCCAPSKKDSCTKEDSGCCEDEATILLQDFDSLVHHADKWDSPVPVHQEIVFPFSQNSVSSHFTNLHHGGTDSGPPIYILFSSLILYA